MKLLPFEGRYLLESNPCPKCGGSGRYSASTPGLPPECWNCRGTGRKPTPRALELYYLISEALEAPVVATGRFEPEHLEMLLGRQLRVGMAVRPLNTREPVREIRRLTPLQLGSRRAEFADGSVLAISPTASFVRRLTSYEIETIQTFMSSLLGDGVVEATS